MIWIFEKNATFILYTKKSTIYTDNRPIWMDKCTTCTGINKL